ncbi:anti-sigma-factor antagonist [Cellulomonas flavigena DSM 20109]|uniref:Anti-sigma factor antagonist n=1 Tax=Cellulomonas flavigena (strain ATCC 482 / DSM 20109 / BCRC 11376 / JCM 18109 / NBRC 3775 / NCIMB 8073 / NRS 134) TaxID=446466 RepID=D5UIT8_CELFN|nr:STAS domain-containing protein [Cellulomonas flavigena]ADG75504.1 anti-sigma-factor antagonist [Cellulomonas flavigena DSM 20109]
MEVDLELRDPGAAVLRVTGRLTMLGAAQLRTTVDRAVDTGHPLVVVDLAEVPFMDSSGLGALVGGLRAARAASGDLRIAAPCEQVRTVLELTTMDKVLRPYAAVDDALRGA